MMRKPTKIASFGPRIASFSQNIAEFAEKRADSFYSTPEWVKLRNFALKRDRYRCQGENCGRSERRMFVDHIIEIKDGGAKLDPANVWTLCGSCHVKKTNRERDKRNFAKDGQGQGAT